jgi:type II secretory pathway component PulF
VSAFRYQAREQSGAAVSGVIEAESRQGALESLSRKGLFPSALEPCAAAAGREPPVAGRPSPVLVRGRIPRKEVAAFTREMATLLTATIPIPAALLGLGEEEENPALKAVILELESSVRKGNSLSGSLAAHPRLFSILYTSMVQVGEEAGALDKVMSDLADLLEHEGEIRSEVLGAVAYPCFVLCLGGVTTFILLAFVLPRLFGMLEGMVDVLPLSTTILLSVSSFFQAYWPWLLGAAGAGALALRWYLKSPAGGLLWDTWKLRLPVVGSVFRASALSRFARTLGTLVRSGVTILPALEIVRNTIGNRLVARSITQIAEETRGGDSLARPLRRLALFPPTVIQMIGVGEETGRLDEMLLRVAAIEERQMRGRSRALISLLAPALILLVGALVGFIVIALLLPIFRMSQVIR